MIFYIKSSSFTTHFLTVRLFKNGQEKVKFFSKSPRKIPIDVINDLYSLFEFKYILIDSIFNYRNFKNMIFELLNDHKFITYQTKEISEGLVNENPSKNIFICFENKWLIIESIVFSLFQEILKQTKSSILCVDNSKIDSDVSCEISVFIGRFRKDINENDFVRETIKPIIAFIIRRHFYPSTFFRVNKNGRGVFQ